MPIEGKRKTLLFPIGKGNGESGRYPVSVDTQDGGQAKVPIHASNLTVATDLVNTLRLACVGEVGLGGYPDRYRHVLYPRQHSMFDVPKEGTCPVPALLGVPLCIVKTPTNLPSNAERQRFDNQWATWLNIDPATGFAGFEWQSFVGSVMIYRPGGEDISRTDLFILIDAVAGILDKFGDDGPFNYAEFITPKLLAGYKTSHVENSKGKGPLDAINI